MSSLLQQKHALLHQDPEQAGMQCDSDSQMQLRQHTRLPGRYREAEVPDLPPNPTFVLPTVPFNPNLPPAAFPTLPLDYFPPAKDASQDMTEDNEDPRRLYLQSPEAGLAEVNKVARPATVFRDTRVAKRGMKVEQDQKSSKTLDEPGVYDGYSTGGTNAGERILLKSHLKAYDAHIEWQNLPDGVKFIMIREFNREMPFEHTVEYLCLEDGDIRYFINLYERELERHREEGERISRANKRQLALLMSGCYGNYDKKQEEWSEILQEEVYEQPFQEPTTFTISRRDIRIAKRFLQDFRQKHEFSRSEAKNVLSFSQLKMIVMRLEQYFGVNTWDDIDIGVLEYRQNKAREVVPQYSPQALGSSPAPNSPARYDVVEKAPTPVAIDAEVKKRTSGRRLTKKDKELIAAGLMKAPAKRPRPTAIRKLAAPSRLREVHNSDDFEEANPTAGLNYPSTPATLTDAAGIHNHSVCPQNPGPRLKLPSLGRNPFQDDSSTKLSSNPDPKPQVFPPKIKLTINRPPDQLAPLLFQPQISEPSHNEPSRRVWSSTVISTGHQQNSADRKTHEQTQPDAALQSSKTYSISAGSLLERPQAAHPKEAGAIAIAMDQIMTVTVDSSERPNLVSANLTPRKMVVGQTDYTKQAPDGKIPVANKQAAGSERSATLQNPEESRKSGLASKEKYPSPHDPIVAKSGSYLASSMTPEKSKLASSSMVNLSMANLDLPSSGNTRPSGAISKVLAAVANFPHKVLARVAPASLYSPQSLSIHEDDTTRKNIIAAPTNISHISLATPTSTPVLTTAKSAVSKLPVRKLSIAARPPEPNLSADNNPKTTSPQSTNPMPPKATSAFPFQAGTKASNSKQRTSVKNQKINSVPCKTSTVGRESKRFCDTLQKPPLGEGRASISESFEMIGDNVNGMATVATSVAPSFNSQTTTTDPKVRYAQTQSSSHIRTVSEPVDRKTTSKSGRKGPGESVIPRVPTVRSKRVTPKQRQEFAQKDFSDILPADSNVEFRRKSSASSQNSRAIRPEANKAIEEPAVNPSTKNQNGKSRATNPISSVEGGSLSFEPRFNSPTASPEPTNPHVTRKRLQVATELDLSPHESMESLKKMGVSSELILEKTRPASRASTNVAHQESQLPTDSMLNSHYSTTVQVVIPKRRASELSHPSPPGQPPKKRQKSRNTSQAATRPAKRASANKASRKSKAKADLDHADKPFRLRKSGVRKKKPANDGNSPDA